MPFVITAAVILLMILLYTFEGGVKTIVYTDTLQTTLMVSGLIICIVFILNNLHLSTGEAFSQLETKGYLNIFNTDINSKGFFAKQILGGAFITIAMTGLDQEMMQKNISVKRLGDSQKNVITMAIILFSVLFLFLFLGGLLYLYGNANGGIYQDVVVNGKIVKHFLLNNINVIGDKAFPSIVLNYFPPAVGIMFIIALISALFPSADGALTALTSSFCIDIIGFKERDDLNEKQKKRLRLFVHFSFTIVFLVCIMVFKVLNDNSIIDKILDLAGYTYGPLLGLFAFGIFTRKQLPNKLIVTVVCLLAPVLSYILSMNAKSWFNGYQIGIELLIINGLFTFVGLWAISLPKPPRQKHQYNIMELILPLAEQYAADFSSPEDGLIASVWGYTMQSHPHAQMISGHVQGTFLTMISSLLQPQRILEIGTFTGYSALCLAKGLTSSGILHTIELREADAATANEYFRQSPDKEKIILHVGNAKDIIPGLHEMWDIVFIDADKTGYIEYYELILPSVKQNGLVIADNVLFHGQVLEEDIRGKNAKAIQAFNIHVRNDVRVEQVLVTMRDGLLVIRKL